jgi:hypothetical protein
MKCCASPTTSIVVNSPEPGRAAQATLQAVLFSEILKPLAANLGAVGDLALESVVQHLFMPPRP